MPGRVESGVQRDRVPHGQQRGAAYPLAPWQDGPAALVARHRPESDWLAVPEAAAQPRARRDGEPLTRRTAATVHRQRHLDVARALGRNRKHEQIGADGEGGVRQQQRAPRDGLPRARRRGGRRPSAARSEPERPHEGQALGRRQSARGGVPAERVPKGEQALPLAQRLERVRRMRLRQQPRLAPWRVDVCMAAEERQVRR
mmetsp:Transcript_26100/g.81729  ORF Transcript_26100/g.81729 Transcript_26100/m.81729 type:complete len:201 (+) Transcript_26100:613-1215(+)